MGTVDKRDAEVPTLPPWPKLRLIREDGRKDCPWEKDLLPRELRGRIE
jgi:hypothetical protein